MIKIRWLGREAYLNDSGIWDSDNNKFAESLNIRAGKDCISGYNPDIKAAMLDLAIKEFRGLEVLENTTDSKDTAKPGEERIY
jgi:hypothetical protein